MKNVVACLAAVAVLAGCGSAQSGAVPQASRLVQAGRGGSWMLPDAKGQALLYVSDTVTSYVDVFSYPKGKLEGSLKDFTDPAGECVDSTGDVFITNTGQSDIEEYAHGGSSAMATLSDSGYFPDGCSIDPITGDLAVANFTTTGNEPGDVVIYKGAKGNPTGNYTDAQLYDIYLCGYDASGNLFLDGTTASSGGTFVLAELPKGGKKLVNITLDQSIAMPGGVQWDGSHLAVEDQSTNTIYQFAISGTKGKKVSSTALAGGSQVFQFFIQLPRVIGPDSTGGNVKIWDYPGGGPARKTFTGVYAPLGTVVSKASRK